MPDTSAKEVTLAYEKRRSALESLSSELMKIITDEVDGPRIDRIYFRVKDTDRFVEKALRVVDGRRKYQQPLRDIEDQIAGRILVFFLGDLAPITKKLCSALGGVEYERRQPGSAVEFGYESDHLIFVIPPHLIPEEWKTRHDVPVTFEVQIRTLFQHAWAEPQHDVGYKGPELADQHRRELAWVAASAWGADHTLDRLWADIGRQ